MADRNLALQLLITAKDQASGVLNQVVAGVKGVGAGVSAALEPLRNFGTLLAAAAGLGGGKELIDRADAYTRLTNQLRVATSSETEYRTALEAVIGVAQRSNADLDSTAGLYGKVAQNAKTLGISQAQVADVTELVAKAMQLSGADANTAAGGIQQLGQAMASGVLRGDEFNSVMEASPKLMEALAAGLGVAVGELRAMAEAGQLTSDTVVKALLSQKIAIDEVYGKLPQTVGQAMTGLSNAGTLFIGQLNEQTGATQSLASGLKFLATNLDAVAALMGAGLVAAAAKYSYSLASQVAASLAAKAAARDLALATAAQQQSALAAAQANVDAAQAAFNRAQAETRTALALQFEIEQTFGLVAGEQALVAARTQSAAAAQASTTAAQRLQTAQSALTAVQATSATATGLFARALGFLTGPGGLILLAVSAFAGLYAAFNQQKPAVDALTVSTDQYAEKLKKATAAQLALNQQELDRQITAQKQQVDELSGSVQRQVEWLERVRVANGNVASATDELNRRQAAFDTELQKLNDLTARRNLLLEEQRQRQAALSTEDAATVGRYNQQAVAMDKLSSAIQDREKYLKTVTSAQMEETTALLATAEAAGRTADADRLTLQLAQQKASAAQTAAELAEAEANAARLKVAALEAIEKVQGRLTPTESAALQAARDMVTARDAEAKATQAQAAQLTAIAQSTENGTIATQRLAAQLTALRDTTESQNAASQRQAEIAKTNIDAALKLAQAKGDEAAAAQLAAEAAQLEVERAQERLGEIENLITLTDRHVNLLYAQAQADGVYTTAERTVIEALQEKVAQLRQEQAQIEAKLPLMERESQQAAIMAGPIGQLGRLYAANTAEHQRAADAADSYYDAQLKEVDAAIRIAKAKGDEAQASELLEKKQGILIEQAYARARALATEVADAQNAVAVKRMELNADGALSEADQVQIAVLENLVVVKQNAAAEASANASAMKEQAAASKEVSDSIKENADSTSKALDDTTSSTGDLSIAFAKMGKESAIAFSGAGIAKFNEIIESINSGIEHANNLSERLANEGLSALGGWLAQGEFNARGLANALEDSESYLDDAADAASENLVSALESAIDAAQDLREELAGVAADYTQKILELAGDDYNSILIDRADALADIQDKYKTAGTLATKEYTDAKNAVIAYYDVKLAKAKQDMADASGQKSVQQMNDLANATDRVTTSAYKLAQTNLSGLINQTSTLTTQVQTLGSFF